VGEMNGMRMRSLIGKLLYGTIFIVVLPTLLTVWARCTASMIHLPVPSSAVVTISVIVLGVLFVLAGMHNLWFYGKGLPMNAYPPKHFVMNGVYAITKNPIYVGTVLVSFGVSALLQSASGFWLVSPLFTLMIVAYTVGFENERTSSVFGKQPYRPFLSLPEATDDALTMRDRMAPFLIAYLPWLLIYEAFIFIGAPHDAIFSNLPFEAQLPVIEFSTLFYVATYVYAILIPFVVRSAKVLRQFEIDVWVATGVAVLLYFAVPFVVRQTQFTPQSFLGEVLLLDRSYDGISAAFPAFHVIWAFIAARYFSTARRNLNWLWYSVAVLISVSCVTTGNHSIIDVLAGVVVFVMVSTRVQIWYGIRRFTERIANSWKEWRFGSVRVINHGLYAGSAGFVGTLLIGSFLGREHAFVGCVIGAFGIVGAALWAQFIEGSPKLQRPYGYYGSVVGVVFGCLLTCLLLTIDFFVLLASFCIAAPWIQMLGRLRCLVQGCCHGKPSSANVGIRFTHPYSRVNKISGLLGTSLYPAQLYSIATNVFVGLIVMRLYTLGTSATFITGMYLLLSGLGRFVEESYRGEAQTPYWAGMRVYQWIAICTIVVGAGVTCVPSVPIATFELSMQSMCWAAAMGMFAIFAYGVDFPNSHRRFARLTSE